MGFYNYFIIVMRDVEGLFDIYQTMLTSELKDWQKNSISCFHFVFPNI